MTAWARGRSCIKCADPGHAGDETVQQEAKYVIEERSDNAELAYKCSRCGGMFGSHGEQVVRCPFCAMICDEMKCRMVHMSNEEY